MNRIENFESEARLALLTAYALDELDSKERAEVEGWLADSPAARQQLEEISQLNTALAAARKGVSLSPRSACLRLDVLGKLADRQSETSLEPRAPAPASSVAVFPRLATLAATLLFTGGLVWTLASGGKIDPAQQRLTQQLKRYDALMQEARYSEALQLASSIDRQVAGRDLTSEIFDAVLGETFPPTEGELVQVPAMVNLPIMDAFGSTANIDNLWTQDLTIAGRALNPALQGSDRAHSAEGALIAEYRSNGHHFIPGALGSTGARQQLLRSNPNTRLQPYGSNRGAPSQGLQQLVGANPGTLHAARSVASFPLPREEESELERLRPSIPVVGDFAQIEPAAVEQYDDRVENAWLSPLAAPLSTFSVDVDTASYANVRRFLTASRLPPTAAVRVEEFVNYFNYNYAPPSGEEAEAVEESAAEGAPVGPVPFAVHMEVADCPWNAQHQLVRIGLRGRDVPLDDRPASNLVFLLDVSGSMGDADKLALVQEAMLLMVEALNENDRVTIVTYAGNTGVRLEPTPGNEQETIQQAIESLQAGGSTYGSAGIELAYKLAVENFVPAGTNRVIWATDGDLNVGVTSDEELIELVSTRAEEGVFLTVLGVGRGNLQDAKLEGIADNGNGHYAYLDSLYEARKVLVHDLSGTLITIAQDVKLQVEFNPEHVAGYRLLGYENRLLAAEDFADDTKDAGEIGAGHSVTALYEIIPSEASEDAQSAPAENSQGAAELPPLRYQVPAASELTAAATSDELLVLALRYKEPTGTVSRRLEYTLAQGDTPFAQASEDFRFAAAAASFAMLLRKSEYTGNATFASVEEYATGTAGEDVARLEFLDLVRQAGVLSFEGLLDQAEETPTRE